MKICFPALFMIDRDDNTFDVSFPDIFGIMAYGRNIDKAVCDAKNCLKTAISVNPSIIKIKPSKLDDLKTKETNLVRSKMIEIEI